MPLRVAPRRVVVVFVDFPLFFVGFFSFDCLLLCSLAFWSFFAGKRIRAKDTNTQLTPLGESLPQTYALSRLYLHLCPLCFLDVIAWFHNRKFTYKLLTTRRAADSSTFTLTYTDTYISVHIYISYQQVARICQLGKGTAAPVGSNVDVNAAPQLQLLLQLQLKVAQVGMTHLRKFRSGQSLLPERGLSLSSCLFFYSECTLSNRISINCKTVFKSFVNN